MAGDVYEAVLPGHVATEVSTGPSPQRVVVRSIDENHVQPDPSDHDSPNRLPLMRVAAIGHGGARNVEARGSGVARRNGAPLRRPPLLQEAVVLLPEAVLLPACVQARERVLPTPHCDGPRQAEYSD